MQTQEGWKAASNRICAWPSEIWRTVCSDAPPARRRFVLGRTTLCICCGYVTTNKALCCLLWGVPLFLPVARGRGNEGGLGSQDLFVEYGGERRSHTGRGSSFSSCSAVPFPPTDTKHT